MEFVRFLNLPTLLKKKSFFLFGSRSTGKSHLIRKQFSKDYLVINLLQSELLLRLTTNPGELRSIIEAHGNKLPVIIDEVQKIPELLNEVHDLIESKKITFLLTGSSARKLRHHGNVNLLAGRAWEANLFPLTFQEIENFNLQRYLQFGGLPAVYKSEEPKEELIAYVNTYLKEEIQAEALVRKIPAFSRFLQLSALTSGDILNYSSLANDAGIPPSTVKEYYSILEDTFVGFTVPAWQKSLKRKPISTAKFYFFDLGAKNTLAQIEHIEPNSDIFGKTFEHFIALELRAYISYNRLHKDLSYWHTDLGHEVDFIIGNEIGVEVKSTNKVTAKHLKGLKYLAEENICKQYFLVSQDSIKRKVNNIVIIHWQEFLKNLWSGNII